MQVSLKWRLCTCFSFPPIIHAPFDCFRAPTAGGQYHWVSEFAPPRHQKFLSYLTGIKPSSRLISIPYSIILIFRIGWLCATGWQAGLVGGCFLIGTSIQGLIILNTNYNPQRWQGTFLTWAFVVICVLFNTVGAKKLPAVETLILMVHVMGLFGIIAPLWILQPRASAHEALLTFTNNGGWPSTGLASMTGLLSPVYSLLGFDCSVHMCEYPPKKTLTDTLCHKSHPEYSRRNQGCECNASEIYHVVCLSQFLHGIHNGNYHVLLHRRH